MIFEKIFWQKITNFSEKQTNTLRIIFTKVHKETENVPVFI